ncbi:hypothetical protein [Xanthocytophaga agilis]|uniref:Uncharacterized protein n=1 Tax=Xanthocytophaga agilis TaxID=3048010 RepID=A0AAE3R924_9BACT|nr:hypothetical protein [Xanthocytophaga agilis]MDJ1502973.1 hypothetical protein [Xanthocytophaga agilis]
MRRNTTIYLISFFLISLFIYSIREQGNAHDWLIKYGKRTTAKVSIKGSNIKYTYFVNGKPYTRVTSKPAVSLETGEQYEVLYDSSNADESIMLFDKPAILDKKDFAVTWTTMVEEVSINEAIRFTYQVEGKEYERYQSLPSEVKFIESKDYKVLYQSKNPKVAYIVW